MIEKLKNELKKDGIIFTKFEKIGYHESYVISEDEKTKIRTSKFKNFEVKCSECGNWHKINTFTYKYKDKKYLCNVCNHLGERNPTYGKHPTEETRKKISEKSKGSNNYWYGKHHTEETKKKLSETLKNSEKFKASITSPEVRQRIRDGMKNSEKLKSSRRSPEYREKKRLQRMKQVMLAISPGPAFNPKACKVFDIISKEKGVYIQHAMNEGEFCVKELGFFLDGYDAENNIAYEYDESFHFVGGQLRQEDVERQNKIEEILHCTFIRLKDEDYDSDGNKIIKEETTIIAEEENNGISTNNEKTEN